MELMQLLSRAEQICGLLYGCALSHLLYSYICQTVTNYYDDFYSF